MPDSVLKSREAYDAQRRVVNNTCVFVRLRLVVWPVAEFVGTEGRILLLIFLLIIQNIWNLRGDRLNFLF